MIHYHGTPVGGSRQDAARFLMGRPAAALLLVMIVAGLLDCGSAGDDPAQRVEKPAQVAQEK